VKLAVQKREVSGKNSRRTLVRRYYPIAAGEPLPPGFDVVLPVEKVDVSSDSIYVRRTPNTKALVDHVGDELKKGATILKKGALLRVQEIGLLSSLQIDKLSVFRMPRVAILPVGIEPSKGTRKSKPSPQSVLGRLVTEAGGRPLTLDAVRADTNELATSLGRATTEADVVLAISDPANAESDPLETAINSFGKPGLVVHGVRIHPGRVMGFGIAAGKPVIIVPRSMHGAVNAFVVFAYPLIRNLLGDSFKEPPEVIASLNTDWQSGKKFQNYTKMVYVSLWTGPDGFVAQPLEAEPARTTIPIVANAYILIPETLINLNRGTKVWAHLLPGFSYAGARFL
jgi:molybdopterin biosynthesis enzyme